MEFDDAWCPACDRQIQPKRFTITVPVQQKQGLVNGTGRLKNVKSQQPPFLRKRTVIDQGPIPLYCSDECRFADISGSATRDGPLLDAARDELTSTVAPIKAPIKGSGYRDTSSETESSSDDSSPHPPPLEARKPVPGWTDGSNAWRASLYSISSRPQHPSGFYPEYSNKASESFSPSPHHAPRASCSSGLHSAQAPLSQCSLSDDMIAKFSLSFQRRSVSPPSPYPSTPTLSSPSDAHSVSRSPPRRERAPLVPAVQGRLLVPNIGLKIHSASSAPLSSTRSSPTSACSARSPLSVTSESDEERSSDSASSLPVSRKRPTIESESSFSFTLITILISRQHGLGLTIISGHTPSCNCHLRRLNRSKSK
jgi:hypothetical protein